MLEVNHLFFIIVFLHKTLNKNLVLIVDFYKLILYNNYMTSYDDRIILDDDVEVEYQKNNNNEERKLDAVSYSNRNVSTNNFFGLAFSKKYLALTFATISIIMALFMRFLLLCGVTSRAFFGIWFFVCAGLCVTSLIMNIINFAKNKKVDLNVSSIITFLSLILLFLI